MTSVSACLTSAFDRWLSVHVYGSAGPAGGRSELRSSSSWPMMREMASADEVSCPILGVMDRLAWKHDLRHAGFCETTGRTDCLMCCAIEGFVSAEGCPPDSGDEAYRHLGRPSFELCPRRTFRIRRWQAYRTRLGCRLSLLLRSQRLRLLVLLSLLVLLALLL